MDTSWGPALHAEMAYRQARVRQDVATSRRRGPRARRGGTPGVAPVTRRLSPRAA